jgi:hypothetical protein
LTVATGLRIVSLPFVTCASRRSNLEYRNREVSSRKLLIQREAENSIELNSRQIGVGLQQRADLGRAIAEGARPDPARSMARAAA